MDTDECEKYLKIRELIQQIIYEIEVERKKMQFWFSKF